MNPPIQISGVGSSVASLLLSAFGQVSVLLLAWFALMIVVRALNGGAIFRGFHRRQDIGEKKRTLQGSALQEELEKERTRKPASTMEQAGAWLPSALELELGEKEERGRWK